MSSIPSPFVSMRPRVARAGDALLHPVEGAIALLALATLALVLSLSAALGKPVAWLDLAEVTQFGLVALAVGMTFRARGRLPRVSLGLVVIGLHLVTTPLLVVLSYFRFPIGGPPIDPLLERADSWLGYSWPDAVAAVAASPRFGLLLGSIYMSSMIQMLLVAILLAGLARRVDLHRFMVVGAVSLTLSIAIWAAAPSFGPATLHEVAPEVARSIGLFTGPEAVATLNRLATEGAGVISAKHMGGNVAFPSFHIVMALMVVWFTRGTRLFPLAVAVNALMVPATLVHGGHHLVDLLGGATVFAASLMLARRLVPRD